MIPTSLEARDFRLGHLGVRFKSSRIARRSISNSSVSTAASTSFCSPADTATPRLSVGYYKRCMFAEVGYGFEAKGQRFHQGFVSLGMSINPFCYFIPGE